jgi:Tfp pilus assembly protein PilX
MHKQECPFKYGQRPSAVQRQRGMVLIFSLIALLILGIGAAAMIRSFDTSAVTAANLGFKRDLTMEGSVAFAQARVWFNNSAILQGSGNQQNDQATYGYKASIQETNSFGIPTVLLDKTPAAPVIKIDSSSNSSLLPGVTVYFLIDRLCNATGAVTSPNTCVISQLTSDKGGTANIGKAGGASPVVFRISVRVDGPHNTHVFMQQTATSS